MSDKKKNQKNFWRLEEEDLDLTMFMITNLTIIEEKNANMVTMALKLKRKVVMELLTTFLPTILLLLRVRKIEDFPDSKIFVAKTFRIKRINCIIFQIRDKYA